MKRILFSLLLVTAGAGWLGLSSFQGRKADARSSSTECTARVECTPRGTCEIVCYDEDGTECCRQEMPCDRPCEARSACTQAAK